MDDKKDLQQAARELVSGWGGSPAERRLFAEKVRNFTAEQIGIAVEADRSALRQEIEEMREREADGFEVRWYRELRDALEDVRALVTEGTDAT